MLIDGIFLNGQQFHNGLLYPISGWSLPLGPTIIPMESGNTILQNRWNAGSGPMNLAPLSFAMSMSICTEDDFFTLMRLASRQLAVPLWFDFELPDIWYIPGRYSTSQIVWYTSRLIPWTLPTITAVTKPPKVFIDDTEQTVLTSGTPGAGEVVLSDTPTNDGAVQIVRRPWGVLTTPASLSGTFLELRWRPQILAVLSNVQFDYAVHNDLRVSFVVNEHLAGVYN